MVVISGAATDKTFQITPINLLLQCNEVMSDYFVHSLCISAWIQSEKADTRVYTPGLPFSPQPSPQEMMP